MMKTSVRGLLKRGKFTVINLIGIITGFTTFFLIILFVYSENLFDKYNQNFDRIYRINNEVKLNTGAIHYPTTAPGIAEILDDELTKVEETGRFYRFHTELIVQRGEEVLSEENILAADPSVFRIFTFNFIEGSPAKALSAPETIVLTRSAAKKYFNKDHDLVGQSIIFISPRGERPFLITGIVEDVPANSHINFDMLTALSSYKQNNNGTFLTSLDTDGFYTYMLASPGTSGEELKEGITSTLRKYINENNRQLLNPYPVALEQIHLHSNLRNELEANGSTMVVYLFMICAFSILVLSGMNYVNLATAQAIKRAKEVGVRKTLGAEKKNLIIQFLIESLILTFTAALVSIVAVYFLVPVFSDIMGRTMSFMYFFRFPLILVVILAALLFGLAAGAYPAFILSSYDALKSLKEKATGVSRGAKMIRYGLVTLQLFITLVLLVNNDVIFRQINYVLNKDLGFDHTDVVVVNNFANSITQKLDYFKSELQQEANINTISATSSIPGGLRPIVMVKTPAITEKENLDMALVNVDFDFLETMDIPVIEGRQFSNRNMVDSISSIIINKEAASILGLGENPVGETIMVNWGVDYEQKRVIGLVDDINFEPLNRKTEGVIYGKILPFYRYILFELNGEDNAATLARVENVWHELAPDKPFEYFYLSDILKKQYQEQEQLSNILTYFTVISILLSCLGLYSLAAFSTEQRTKEIGVRKVLGATKAQILWLVVKNFLILLAGAFILALPVSFLFSSKWLEEFVYRINIPAISFTLALLITLSVILISISYSVLLAASRNPVKSLKYE
ncbi:ABC transporter permease [Roseivirga sp. BDSF3-8]|uniref:ABC transporter permease n=1 Tax=Roseivirga sp. BDSF3-8 TaxID=3241598 RepID=UPI00353226F0